MASHWEAEAKGSDEKAPEDEPDPDPIARHVQNLFNF